MKWQMALLAFTTISANADFNAVKAANRATPILEKLGFAVICVPSEWEDPETSAANLNAVLMSFEKKLSLTELSLNSHGSLCGIVRYAVTE